MKQFLTLDECHVGMRVNVERRNGDQFNHDFTGTIKEVHSDRGLVIVEDQDGDCWDCEPDQLSHNTDDIMHG